MSEIININLSNNSNISLDKSLPEQNPDKNSIFMIGGDSNGNGYVEDSEVNSELLALFSTKKLVGKSWSYIKENIGRLLGLKSATIIIETKKNESGNLEYTQILTNENGNVNKTSESLKSPDGNLIKNTHYSNYRYDANGNIIGYDVKVESPLNPDLPPEIQRTTREYSVELENVYDENNKLFQVIVKTKTLCQRITYNYDENQKICEIGKLDYNGDFIPTGSGLPSIKPIKISQDNIYSLESNNNMARVEGFEGYKLNLKISKNVNINLNFYVSSELEEKEIQSFTNKLAQAIKKMPQNVLEDFSKECRTIFINDKIDNNEKAWALAVPPLDQLILSYSQLDKISNEDFETTLVHELGHLIDGYNYSDRCSSYYSREFEELKTLLTEDLGFDVSSHTLDNVKEFYADCYLSQNYKLNNEHRAARIFDLLNEYKFAVENYLIEDLQQTYGDKLDKIKIISQKYNTLLDGFKYYRENIDNGYNQRVDDSKDPMSLEQLIKISN